MRDQSISIATGRLVIGCNAGAERAWLELSGDVAEPATAQLTGAQLIETIQALVFAYGELLNGPSAPRAAHAVTRTLHNRTHAARERQSSRDQRGRR